MHYGLKQGSVCKNTQHGTSEPKVVVKFTNRNQKYTSIDPKRFQALVQEVSLVFSSFRFLSVPLPLLPVVAWAITRPSQKSQASRRLISEEVKVNSVNLFEIVWGKKAFVLPLLKDISHLGIWSHVAFSLPPLRHTCSHNWIHTHPIHRADICRPLSVEGGTSNR